jgi:microsomal dipeptidase-like Zn-dependent dipeptidase
MNYYGIMIDLSHPSKKANLEMLALSKAPVIASHSSARALCEHPRNLDDKQLLAIKKNGGVVQTVALGSYLNAEKVKSFNTLRDSIYKEIASEIGVEMISMRELRGLPASEVSKYRANYKKIVDASKNKIEDIKKIAPPVSVIDFVDHIDYLVKTMGISHVGISSDFDGGGGIEGWSDASETLNVTKELLNRGYNQEEIRKIWGDNLLRVMEEVENVSKKLQGK